MKKHKDILTFLANFITSYSDYFAANEPVTDLLREDVRPFHADYQEVYYEIRRLLGGIDFSLAEEVDPNLEGLPDDVFWALYQKVNQLYRRRSLHQANHKSVSKFMCDPKNRKLFITLFTGQAFIEEFLKDLKDKDSECHRQFKANDAELRILLPTEADRAAYRSAILSSLTEKDTLPDFLFNNPRITAFFALKSSHLKKLIKHFTTYSSYTASKPSSAERRLLSILNAANKKGRCDPEADEAVDSDSLRLAGR